GEGVDAREPLAVVADALLGHRPGGRLDELADGAEVVEDQRLVDARAGGHAPCGQVGDAVLDQRLLGGPHELVPRAPGDVRCQPNSTHRPTTEPPIAQTPPKTTAAHTVSATTTAATKPEAAATPSPVIAP